MMNTTSNNVVWHEHIVTPSDLEALHQHKGLTIWFTGLSASGKSTLANALAAELHQRKVSTFVLDGDNIRHGLNKDLGFSPKDREENIRRIGEVAKLFTAAGIVNMTAFISPYASDRLMARNLQPERFAEVFCDASLDVCEQRDPKGMYKKARAGLIKQFTGLDAPYEPPPNPEIHLRTDRQSIDECIKIVIDWLEEHGIISSLPQQRKEMAMAL
ncbi:MAG: adenylyl-sulfate kinase [Desulfobacteraceae bacterium]|nr:adenylyl-sulfate kinase [Desulfobacteraceae bacterium]